MSRSTPTSLVRVKRLFDTMGFHFDKTEELLEKFNKLSEEEKQDFFYKILFLNEKSMENNVRLHLNLKHLEEILEDIGLYGDE